jgi:SAM-dependent methyltransferase
MPAATYTAKVASEFNQQWARKYRQLDQLALAAGGAGDHYCSILRTLSASFGRPIDVLDIGCGTGRYFHCLTRVHQLIGVDISASMLEQAKDPIGGDQLDVQTITLLCGDALSLTLPRAGFDLIYSIGVLGEYSPLNETVTRRLRALLAPGGMLFVTAVDSASRVSVPENEPPPFIRRLARKGFPMLPRRPRRLLNRRLSPFYISRPQLESAFAAAGFRDVTVTEFVHTSGWLGTHWDCLAKNQPD